MACHLEDWMKLLRQRFSRRSGVEEVSLQRVKLDSDWINLETLRTWLPICVTKHGDLCKLSKVAVVLPQWLIDVRRLCLVKVNPGDTYVALSYLQQLGRISDSNLIIPRTIRDAIRLTELLGEQLLWVVSLCIVQDDVESNHAQLNEMASIYANSYVTLIAANGWDANHGLGGIKGVTETRMISPKREQDISESLQPYSTIWYSRGWTFQELIFSPRKIMFQYRMAI